MKTRKINITIGELNWIKVPTDFRKAKGIRASTRETNSLLAPRDYSVMCNLGSEPLMIVEGVWIWWCFNHHQPYSHCEFEKLKAQGEKGVAGGSAGDGRPLNQSSGQGNHQAQRLRSRNLGSLKKSECHYPIEKFPTVKCPCRDMEICGMFD